MDLNDRQNILRQERGKSKLIENGSARAQLRKHNAERFNLMYPAKFPLVSE
jgi:hypothetical protein